MARSVVTFDAGTLDANGATVAITSGVTVTEAGLSLSDNTTANVSTSKHGLTPKLPNDATKFLDGTGAFAVPSGSGIPATIFDAQGDLIVASAADTAARFALGATGKVPTSNGTTLAYGYPPGYQLDYVEGTSNVTVTGTSAGSPTTILTANAVTFDGSTRIALEFYAAVVENTSDGFVQLQFFDGSTDIGIFADIQAIASGSTTSSITASVLARRFLTPSAAAHTFSVRGFKSGGTATVYGSAGGAGAFMPMYVRIVVA